MAAKKVQVVQIKAQLAWHAYRDPDTNTWIGTCKPLNLNAVGETFDELQACANEAMGLLFADLVETGEFAQFLKRNGWTAGPLPTGNTAARFDVPAEWKTSSRFAQLVG